MLDHDRKQLGKMQSVPLYIAGLPAQIPLSCVLDFFSEIDPCFSLEKPDNEEQACRQKFKGYCYLVCHKRRVAISVLEQRFFSFYGRTLTVMLRKKGVALIIQNKNAKRCRVLLKRVHRSISEIDLVEVLENMYGPVETLFQLKSNDPFDRAKEDRVQYSQFHTFSVHFKSHSDASRLLKDGHFALKGNHMVFATKGNQLLSDGQDQGTPKLGGISTNPSPSTLNVACQPKVKPRTNDERLKKYGLATSQGRSIPKIDCDHVTRPTNRQYFAGETGNWRFQEIVFKQDFWYRLNYSARDRRQ